MNESHKVNIVWITEDIQIQVGATRLLLVYENYCLGSKNNLKYHNDDNTQYNVNS